MTMLFYFEKKVTKVVSCCIVCNLTTKPKQNFCVGGRIKDKLLLSYASDVTWQPLGLSKFDKICDTDG